MKEWLTVSDLCNYLQLSESKINLLIKQKQIPLYNNHGFLRFSQSEIDDWMKVPATESITDLYGNDVTSFHYRGIPIKDYSLTASLVLQGKPIEKLPEFIKGFITKLKETGRDCLDRNDFQPLISNYNDYLRISCQLGLIDKKQGVGRRKLYCPNNYSHKIFSEESSENIKKIILECIQNIVEHKMEKEPDERHAILLLWYYLTLKEKGILPDESHFNKNESSYYPNIRLQFSKSLCNFLFMENDDKEQDYLNNWKGYL